MLLMSRKARHVFLTFTSPCIHMYRMYVSMYVLYVFISLGHAKWYTSHCALKIASVAILIARSHSTSVQVVDTLHSTQSLYTIDGEFVTHSQEIWSAIFWPCPCKNSSLPQNYEDFLLYCDFVPTYVCMCMHWSCGPWQLQVVFLGPTHGLACFSAFSWKHMWLYNSTNNLYHKASSTWRENLHHSSRKLFP